MSETPTQPTDGSTDTDEADHPGQVLFALYGIDAEDLDGVWDMDRREEYDVPPRYDHEAHHAATEVMDLLKENFDWADDLTGVAMGVRGDGD